MYLGDVETLYKLLLDKGRLTPKKIDNDLAKIDIWDEIPIAQQLSDYYANKSIADTTKIISNKAKKGSIDGINVKDAQIGSFLRKWISLEKKLMEIEEKSGYQWNQQGKRRPIRPRKDILPEFVWGEYTALRRFRNSLVHGLEVPTSAEIEDYENIIEEIMNIIAESGRSVYSI